MIKGLSLTGHKHFGHFKCGPTLLALSHLHMVSPHLSSSKLDQIGQGEWCNRRGREGEGGCQEYPPSIHTPLYIYLYIDIYI